VVFWAVAVCSVVGTYVSLSGLPSKMLVSNHNTWCNNPENYESYFHCYENLKSCVPSEVSYGFSQSVQANVRK